MRWALCLVGGVLLVDGVVLLALGHTDLGALLPAALGMALGALAAGWGRVAAWRQTGPAWRQRLWSMGWWGVLLWLVSLAVFWASLPSAGEAPAAAPPVSAIVVLGGAIHEGRPRATLQARLDTAAALARLQPGAVLAVCGGKVRGEADTEAAAMAGYLQQRHGIAASRILLEGESTSTALNLQRVGPLLQARGTAVTEPIALVTSDFHMPRALRIAQRQGFVHMVPVAAPTPLHVRYNAWLREYFATLSSWALREG